MLLRKVTLLWVVISPVAPPTFMPPFLSKMPPRGQSLRYLIIELSESTFVIISKVNLLLSGKLFCRPTVSSFELYVANCVELFEFCIRVR